MNPPKTRGKTTLTISSPMSNIIQHNKYPLFISLLVQLFGLLLFASTSVQHILPAGNNHILDWIYANSSIIRWSYYFFAVLFGLSLLSRKNPKAIKIICFLFFLTSAAFHFPWLLVLIYPLLIQDISPIDDNQKTLSTIDLILLGVCVGSFALMSQQVPFPHETALNIWYIYSLSMLFLIAGVFIFLGVFSLVYLGSSRLRQKNISYKNLNLLLLLILLYLSFWIYADITFTTFIDQFKLFDAAFMVAGLLTSIVLLLVSPIEQRESFERQLSFLYLGLTNKVFWIKFIVLFLAARELFIWLIEAEQDFLVVLIYDLTNAIFPFLSFWLGLGLVYKLFRRIRSVIIIRIMLVFVIGLGLIPSFLFSDQNWTFKVELNRPPAQFISKQSRNILQFIGIDTERDVSKKLNLLRAEIVKKIEHHKLEKEAHLMKERDNAAHETTYQMPFQPHIFIIAADAVYAQQLSVYGYHRRTSPHLEAFAKEAVLFKNYYSASSATSMAVGAIFTGEYIGNYSGGASQRDNTLCRSLKQNGYQLVLSKLVKSLGIYERSKECHQARFMSYKADDPKDWSTISEALTTNPEKPLFVYIHPMGGHNPWVLSDEEKIFGKGKIDIYDALLYKADLKFFDIVQKIKGLGIYERSIIIFTSDHGVGLGKHFDQVSYSNLYNVNLQVPFIIRVPGNRVSTVKNTYSHVDLRPTIESLLGIPIDPYRHGTSFARELFEPVPAKERCVFAIATYSDKLATQCASGVKVIYNRDYSFLEIFNTKNDPLELRPIGAELDSDRFLDIVQSFAAFLAFGRDSYSRHP